MLGVNVAKGILDNTPQIFFLTHLDELQPLLLHHLLANPDYFLDAIILWRVDGGVGIAKAQLVHPLLRLCRLVDTQVVHNQQTIIEFVQLP